MLAFLAAALFVVGAIAADGHNPFGLGWPALTWLLLGLAAWVLHGQYPIAVPTFRRRA